MSFSHDDQKYDRQISVKSEPSDEMIAFNEYLNDPNQDVLFNKNYSKKPFQHKYSHGHGSGYKQKFVPYHSDCKINPKNQFGHTMACNFCSCLYHLFASCPYKPKSVNLSDHQSFIDNQEQSKDDFEQQHY